MSGAADEKKKATPVGVANVERRTWNEQEYEEKAAQRDEEVKILFGRIGRDGDDDGKNDDLLWNSHLYLSTPLSLFLKPQNRMRSPRRSRRPTPASARGSVRLI